MSVRVDSFVVPREVILGNAQTLKDALTSGDVDVARQVINHYPGDGWKMVERECLTELMLKSDQGFGQLREVLDKCILVIDRSAVVQAFQAAIWRLQLRGDNPMHLRRVIINWLEQYAA